MSLGRTTAPPLAEVPLSFSYGLSPQEARPKSQTLRVEQGVPVLRPTPPRSAGGSPATTMTMGGSAGSSPSQQKTSPATPATPEKMTESMRPWQEFPGERLSFLGFYVETVTIGTENVRVHHVVIQYFPEDGSLQIIEAALPNSGIAGGKILSRRRVPKSALTSTGATALADIGVASSTSLLKSLAGGGEGEGGGFVSHEELRVGANLKLFGRTYHIWACDARTRSFLQERFGIEQPEDEMERLETFEAYNSPPPFLRAGGGSTSSSPFSTTSFGSTSPEDHASDTYYGRKWSPEKRFIEALRGSSSVTARVGSRDRLAQWLAADARDCLRFVGVIDEGGNKRIVTVKQYLADDDIEVVEKETAKSFTTIWKKRPAPNKPGLYHDSRGRDCFDDDKGEKDYYHLGDLRVGESMLLAGRKVLLVDCDDKTLEWYRSNLGLDMADRKIDISEPPVEKKPPALPPYSGWGTEEDSLASMHLIPKRPHKDWKKLLEHAGEVLRFTAKFANPKNVAESERAFTISYEVPTESITVFEPFQVNSGVMSNKFQQKMRLTNPDTGKPFAVEDFEPGKVLVLNSFAFRLEGPDARTVELLNKLARSGKRSPSSSPTSPGKQQRGGIAAGEEF